MKTLTVRLPDELVAEIEAESRELQRTRSDVVRERLSRRAPRRHKALDAIVDLVGAVPGLPVDLSTRKKAYLKKTGYGGKRHR